TDHDRRGADRSAPLDDRAVAPPAADSRVCRHLPALRSALAEQALGPEHEDQDQDAEDDRLCPVASRRVPVQTFVERLDEADAEGAEDGARKVADPTENGGGEREQTELEPLV